MTKQSHPEPGAAFSNLPVGGLAPEMVSIATAEAMTGFSRNTISQMCGDGRLESVKIGRRRMVKYESIRRLAAGEGEPSRPAVSSARRFLCEAIDEQLDPRDQLRVLGKIGSCCFRLEGVRPELFANYVVLLFRRSDAREIRDVVGGAA